jgi:hypothetical protein
MALNDIYLVRDNGAGFAEINGYSHKTEGACELADGSAGSQTTSAACSAAGGTWNNLQLTATEYAAKTEVQKAEYVSNFPMSYEGKGTEALFIKNLRVKELLIEGDATVEHTNQTVIESETFSITNDGPGPALSVDQTGSSSPSVWFKDSGSTTLFIDESGNVGIGSSFGDPSSGAGSGALVSASSKLDVNGIVTWTGGNSTNANLAYEWGDHATQGYGQDTGSTGDFAVGGNATWTGGNSTNANFAYEWGDHATQGYGQDTGSTGDFTVGGNLTVDGTTTTINSTTLDVEDLNITVAKGADNAAAANGAGLTVDGAGATLLYNSSLDKWSFNKGIQVTTAGLWQLITNPAQTKTQAQYDALPDDASSGATDHKGLYSYSANSIRLRTDSANGTALGSVFEMVQTSTADSNLTYASNLDFQNRDSLGNFQSRLYIKHDGNVGIGTSLPYTALEVSAASNVVTGGNIPVALRISHTNQDYGNGTYDILSDIEQLQFWSPDASHDPAAPIRASVGMRMENAFGSKSSLTFGTHEHERMTIDSLGNVGIGESNPSSRIDAHVDVPNIGIGSTNYAYQFRSTLNDNNPYGYSMNAYFGSDVDSVVGSVAIPKYAKGLHAQQAVSNGQILYGDSYGVFGLSYAREGGTINGNSISVFGQGAIHDGTGNDPSRAKGHVTGDLIGVYGSVYPTQGTVDGNRYAGYFAGNTHVDGDLSVTDKVLVNAEEVLTVKVKYEYSEADTAIQDDTHFYVNTDVNAVLIDGIYEVYATINNDAGQGIRQIDVLYGKVVIGSGGSGGIKKRYVNYVRENPQPRDLYDSNGTTLNHDIAAYLVQGAAVGSDANADAGAQLRLTFNSDGKTNAGSNLNWFEMKLRKII